MVHVFYVIINVPNFTNMYARMHILQILWYFIAILMYSIVLIGFWGGEEFFSEVYDAQLKVGIIKLIIQCNNYNRSGVYYWIYFETCTNCSPFQFEKDRETMAGKISSRLSGSRGELYINNMRDVLLKKALKFEQIPIGLDARRYQGGP